MVNNLEVSPIKFYKIANDMLEKKDLLEFITNISKAELLSANDQELFSKTLFLKAKGLFYFHQHKKALEAISIALEYNSKENLLNLRIYEGIIYGYLGELDKAIDIFKAIIAQTEDKLIVTKAYLNIAWVYLGFDQENIDEKKLEESKEYLDLVNENFDSLNENMKWRLLTNYSVYYYFIEEYEKAIDLLKDCIRYCGEQGLADVYNNLAELYIKSDVLEIAKGYLEKAELIGTKYNRTMSLGHTYHSKAIIYLREDQIFSALDSLYLSFDYFKDTEMSQKAYDILSEINEVIKDLVNLITNISQKGLLLENEHKMFAKNTFFKTKGLFSYHQNKKTLEIISKVKEVNPDLEPMNLRLYEGIVYVYLGEVKKAANTFKSIIDQSKDKSILAKAYLNIAWIGLGFDQENIDDNKLSESKKYLDLANRYFENLSDYLKWRILSNYSVYYYFKGENEKAIKMLEESIKYCEEEDLSRVYNTLSELYIKASDDNCSVPEIVQEYLTKSEILGTKYNLTGSLGQTFYLRAEVELHDDQLFSALDTLYLAFEYFKSGKETAMACNCVLKINQLIDEYKQNSLSSIKNKLQKKLRDKL